MRVRTNRILVELAGKAILGVVTRAQVDAAGGAASWLRSQLRTGTLRQLEADVFVLSGSLATNEVPWEVEALAACLQRGTAARLGSASAARIWQLSEGQNATSDRIQVVVPAGRAFRSTNRVQVHRTRRLTSHDVTTFGGVPVTTVARTLIDLGASLGSAAVERVVDDALVRGLTTVPLLAGSLQRNAHRGCAGASRVRAALELWRGGALESHAETEVLRWLLRAGVPEPVRQLDVVVRDGKRFRLDLAWPARRVALEVDSYAHHHGPRQLSADHERRSAITAMGWQVLTTTVAEVRRGGANLLAALETSGVITDPARAKAALLRTDVASCPSNRDHKVTAQPSPRSL